MYLVDKTIGAVLHNNASIIFFATDHTVVWLDTVSHCYTNSLAIEYTFFEELFAAIYNFNLHEV